MSRQRLYFVIVIIQTKIQIKMKIRKSVLSKIAENKGLRARLCAEMDKSYFTINKWINENDDNLTKAAALRIIREELELTDDQILEQEKTAA